MDSWVTIAFKFLKDGLKLQGLDKTLKIGGGFFALLFCMFYVLLNMSKKAPK